MNKVDVGDYVETKEGVNGLVDAIKNAPTGQPWIKISTSDMREYTCPLSHVQGNSELTGVELAQIAIKLKRAEEIEKLLEAAVEELESHYGRDTELTIEIRNTLND